MAGSLLRPWEDMLIFLGAGGKGIWPEEHSQEGVGTWPLGPCREGECVLCPTSQENRN